MSSNIFTNESIFLNNSLNLPSEKINNNYTNNNQIYNIILQNILISLKNIDFANIKFSSIKFYSEKNKYIMPSIINISKKFIINNDIYLGTGLFYVIFINKKITISKPINDTITILNKKYELVELNNNCHKSFENIPK